jgi:hypothetical protein
VDYFTLKDVKDFEKKKIKETKEDFNGRTPEDAINKVYEEFINKEDPPLPLLDTMVGLTNFVKSTIKEWETTIKVINKNL